MAARSSHSPVSISIPRFTCLFGLSVGENMLKACLAALRLLEGTEAFTVAAALLLLFSPFFFISRTQHNYLPVVKNNHALPFAEVAIMRLGTAAPLRSNVRCGTSSAPSDYNVWAASAVCAGVLQTGRRHNLHYQTRISLAYSYMYMYACALDYSQYQLALYSRRVKRLKADAKIPKLSSVKCN